MKIIKNIVFLVLILTVIPAVYSCMDDTPPDHNDNQNIGKEETRIIPASPTSVDEVKIIINDCKYYVLASVTEKGKDITVKRRFNSQMKWPCVLALDTVSLGQLRQGDYSVILLIVDTNPMVSDSIVSKETLALTVTK